MLNYFTNKHDFNKETLQKEKREGKTILLHSTPHFV